MQSVECAVRKLDCAERREWELQREGWVETTVVSGWPDGRTVLRGPAGPKVTEQRA